MTLTRVKIKTEYKGVRGTLQNPVTKEIFYQGRCRIPGRQLYTPLQTSAHKAAIMLDIIRAKHNKPTKLLKPR